MRRGGRRGLAGLAGLIALLVVAHGCRPVDGGALLGSGDARGAGQARGGPQEAAPAVAGRTVEYRLQAVSLYDTAYTYFLSAGELNDGATGPGLDRLEASLDRGGVSKGAILYDRRIQPVRESVARAFGGSRVIPQMKPRGEGPGAWDEIVWEGTPGERSVWVVSPQILIAQMLYNAALRGTGPMQNFQPYSMPMDGGKVTLLTIPLNFLSFYADRGTIWSRYLSRGLDLKTGIGAVVGVNTNQAFPDEVYVIVSHAPTPTTYKAVLVWRRRASDQQAPGSQNPLFMN